MPALKYAARINGLTGFAFTKLDVLSGEDTLKVCTAYKVDGKITGELPLDGIAEPVYETFPGWKDDLSGCSTMDSLPKAARDYVQMVEKALGIPAWLVGTGQDRTATIITHDPMRR